MIATPGGGATLATTFAGSGSAGKMRNKVARAPCAMLASLLPTEATAASVLRSSNGHWKFGEAAQSTSPSFGTRPAVRQKSRVPNRPANAGLPGRPTRASKIGEVVIVKRAARLTVLVATTAIGVAAAANYGFAQAGGPIDPGVYVAEVVHPLAPFQTPTIAPASVNLGQIQTVLEPLDAAALLEVRQRCSTVVANAARYGEPAVAFCNATFAWVAANRPNAPNTDAELAAMPR